MRLAHYLAQCGLCSRKEASRRITQGRVQFQGRLANHTDTITDIDAEKIELFCDGIEVDKPKPKAYWIYNKPVGIDCRLLPEDKNSLYHVIKHLPRLFPVGRLDKDSHGLLLLTNDGALNHRLMHPSFVHPKRYKVRVNRKIEKDFIEKMSIGVSYKDVTTLPCSVALTGTDTFEITLTQGLNRQIRRMSQALGYKVIDLQRVAIGELELTDLLSGELRQLTVQERTLLPQ